MADDTLELFQPIFENNPQSCPKNMLPYEHRDLLPKQQRALNNTKVPTVRDNQQYLHAHPEVNAIVSLLLRNVFASRPKNIPEFLGNFMARPEVEDEIRAFMYNELHTGLEPGTDSPNGQESKLYHFLNEERGEEDDSKDSLAEESLNDIPELHRMHEKIKAKKRLKTSVSEATDGGVNQDLYKVSQISGAASSSKTFGFASLFESDQSIGDTRTLLTLMEPRSSSSISHNDSIGSCSLLEDLSDPKFASDTENQIVIQGSLFKQSHSDLNQGSSLGDHLNDEMIMHMPKRNISGLSAISEQGIFKAVGVEDVPHGRKHSPVRGAQPSFQEEDEEAEEGNKEDEE